MPQRQLHCQRGSQKQHPYSLQLSAQLGTNKGDGSLRSEIVFIVYIKLGKEGFVSLVIAGISETCKLFIPRVLVLSASG